MGSVHVDTNKSELRHDTIHPYTSTGIRRLLRDIHRLPQMESYDGDYDAVNIRIDLESALQSNATTPRQRCALQLYYMAGLTQSECAKILGIAQPSIQERVENGVANIAAHMSGGTTDATQIIYASIRLNLRRYDALNDWVELAMYNREHWWDVNDAALADINDIVGMPVRDENMDASDDVYPYLTDGQLRARNREREILREEIYPPLPNVGTIRSPINGKKLRLH